MVDAGTITLPLGIEVKDVLIAGNRVFLCGEDGRRPGNGPPEDPRQLGSFRLGTGTPLWAPLAMPQEMRDERKSIDALLADGTTLLAIDNIVYPKWILRYDIADPERPRYLDQVRLDNHGTYEHIAAAAVGAQWVAVASRTVGMFGSGAFVALLERSSLAEAGVIWGYHRRTFEGRPTGSANPEMLDWEPSLGFLSDLLVAAAGPHGLGLFDTRLMSSDAVRAADAPLVGVFTGQRQPILNALLGGGPSGAVASLSEHVRHHAPNALGGRAVRRVQALEGPDCVVVVAGDAADAITAVVPGAALRAAAAARRDGTRSP